MLRMKKQYIGSPIVGNQFKKSKLCILYKACFFIIIEKGIKIEDIQELTGLTIKEIDKL